jgi:hypothetical protein
MRLGSRPVASLALVAGAAGGASSFLDNADAPLLSEICTHLDSPSLRAVAYVHRSLRPEAALELQHKTIEKLKHEAESVRMSARLELSRLPEAELRNHAARMMEMIQSSPDDAGQFILSSFRSDTDELPVSSLADHALTLVRGYSACLWGPPIRVKQTARMTVLQGSFRARWGRTKWRRRVGREKSGGAGKG